jgi:DNA-binding XRE family transcriptional regulator
MTNTERLSSTIFLDNVSRDGENSSAIFFGTQPLLTIESPAVLPAASAVLSERVVVRCPSCRLVQYSTASNRCRRCYLPLTVQPPPPPPAPAPSRPNVAAGVRNWRRMRGLTQKQLAVASQLPRTYISRIENGRIIPGLVTLERVAGALSVSLPFLLGSPNGNGAGKNGNNGNGNGYQGIAALACLGGAPWAANASPAGLDGDACLKEMLRYSGLLTGVQRQMVLTRVRQMVPAPLVAAH